MKIIARIDQSDIIVKMSEHELRKICGETNVNRNYRIDDEVSVAEIYSQLVEIQNFRRDCKVTASKLEAMAKSIIRQDPLKRDISR